MSIVPGLMVGLMKIKLCYSCLLLDCVCKAGIWQLICSAFKGKKQFGVCYFSSFSGANGVFGFYCVLCLPIRKSYKFLQ